MLENLAKSRKMAAFALLRRILGGAPQLQDPKPAAKPALTVHKQPSNTTVDAKVINASKAKDNKVEAPVTIASKEKKAKAAVAQKKAPAVLKRTLGGKDKNEVKATAQPATPVKLSDADMLEDLSRYLTSDILQGVQLLSGNLGFGTPGEYSLGALQKMLKLLKEHCNVDPERSQFADIGSGLGRPVFAAVLSGVFKSGYGIEIVPQLAQVATNTAARYGISERVKFEHADASIVGMPRDADFIYMFSTGFPPGLLKQLAAALNKQQRWKWLLTATSPDDWRDAGLALPSSVYKILSPMPMVGSHSSHRLFVIPRRDALVSDGFRACCAEKKAVAVPVAAQQAPPVISKQARKVAAAPSSQAASAPLALSGKRARSDVFASEPAVVPAKRSRVLDSGSGGHVTSQPRPIPSRGAKQLALGASKAKRQPSSSSLASAVRSAMLRVVAKKR